MQNETLNFQTDKAISVTHLHKKLDVRVVLVYRKPLPAAHSIEYLFHNIFRELENSGAVQEFELPRFSKGIVNRIRNIKALLQFRKCVVHITGDSYYAIVGAIFCKRVLTVHDLRLLNRSKGIRRFLVKLFWVTIPVKLAHKITVVSEMTRALLIKETSIPLEKVRVIYNFIDPIYKPVCRRFNMQCPRILQVGTAFNKNIERLAKALAGLNCTLMVIGRLSETQKNALEAAKVQYHNRYSISLEELHQEYLRADLLTFVSTVEGFGMPILEAQATGLPVITSNCSSMPEVAGSGAYFVDPLDVKDIRKGLLELIQKEGHRTYLVREGYKNVKRFSKKRVAEEYLAVYQELMV